MIMIIVLTILTTMNFQCFISTVLVDKIKYIVLIYGQTPVYLTHKQLWPLLLTWINFNPSMDK